MALVLILLASPAARAAKWERVDPADLAATASTAFPGADTEILLSRHVLREIVPQSVGGTTMTIGDQRLACENFIRAKIYTAKGVVDLGHFPILFHSRREAVNTAARVVKPDGSSVELKKGDIFESVRAKTRNEGEMKQITFVFPGLEPGDVVEYRWTEQLGEELWFEMFYCQETIPVRECRFLVADMQGIGGTVAWRNCPEVKTDTRDGLEISMQNLPAYEEEEYMPPMRDFRGAIYIAKRFVHWSTDKQIWTELSSYWGDPFNMATRPGAAIKQKAAALAAGAATDEEKLSRLYEYCQGGVFNTSYHTNAALKAEIEKHAGEDAQAPAKTLEKERGRADEINILFGALARALGFEARLAYNASRFRTQNVLVPQGWAFIHDLSSVAVKVAGQWHYYNPGNFLLPFGMLAAESEGATTLLCDTKKLEHGTTAVSRGDQNQYQRKGRFKLDEEGTLEGEVEIVFLGDEATTFKIDNWSKTLEEVKKAFRETFNRRLPNAEVSDIEWTNLENRQMPLSVKYRVRVPGYAEQMGKRLVFAPAFFKVGTPVVFAPAERKFPIVFSNPWQEHDDVEIVLPEGFALDQPSAPQPVGDPAGPFGATYTIKFSGKTRTLGYRRDFGLGANGAFAFRTESYPALKGLFEKLHKSDTHSLIIKPKEIPAVPAAAPAQP